MSRGALPWPPHLAAREPVASHTLTTTCAFRDCDPMGVLWHGHHLAYCELARHALGAAIGLGIADFQTRQLFAPVVHSRTRHLRPIPAEAPITLHAALYPSTQPRLYHRYRIELDGALATEAETEQVLTDRAFGMLLQVPEWLGTVFGLPTHPPRRI